MSLRNVSLCQVLSKQKKENILVFYKLLIKHNYEIGDSELELQRKQKWLQHPPLQQFCSTAINVDNMKKYLQVQN